MGLLVSALAVQGMSPQHHYMKFKVEGRTYDVQNNGSVIVVRDEEMRTVLYEWIPYTCAANPYAVKTHWTVTLSLSLHVPMMMRT